MVLLNIHFDWWQYCSPYYRLFLINVRNLSSPSLHAVAGDVKMIITDDVHRRVLEEYVMWMALWLKNWFIWTKVVGIKNEYKGIMIREEMSYRMKFDLLEHLPVSQWA